MKKIYKKLTGEQIKRGVIFSSSLSSNTSDEGSTIHEVTKNQENWQVIIDRLLDDKFFNSSPWKYNVIRK